MPVKPPKQFCGNEHWSGESCKECDAIKARKFPPLSPPARPTEVLGPCLKCEQLKRDIGALGVEIADLQEKVREHETRIERERLATLKRVQEYRARKAEGK